MFPASYWVEKYNMQVHPEGGYFKETYRSEGSIAKNALPANFKGDRSFATGIYFLLESHHFSAFHRIESDELWHFYTGCPLNVYYIDNEGNMNIIKLGDNPENGEVFQAVVPAGVWFGSKPTKPDGYSLVGCTVSPGFDFQDFELANRQNLLEQYPQHEVIIKLLTY